MTELVILQEKTASEKAPQIGQLVMGITNICDLDCDYCPIFNGGDDSWKEQPKVMSMAVVGATATRLAEELDRDEVPRSSFSIVLQRGEPTAAPVAFFDEAIPLLQKTVGRRTVLKFGMQTNGTHLNDRFLQMARRQRLTMGVSLDGPQYVNDLHRRTHKGRSAHASTMRGVERLVGDGRYKDLFTGFLAVMPSVKDLQDIDPLEVYKYFMQYNPPALDFLLPHMHWESLQPGMQTQEERDQAPYAKWLEPIFDHWIKNDILKVRIRTFDSILQVLRGDGSSVESIGESGPDQSILLAINGDGGYEMVDTLSVVPGQVSKVGLNVLTHSFEQASAAITKKAKRLGMLSMAPMCQGCPHRKECGGGYVTHRYSSANLFDNPSAYCADLAALNAYIKGVVVGISHEMALARKFNEHRNQYVASG